MKTVKAYTASPINDERIEGLVITATTPCPEHKTLGHARIWHRRRGREIAEALWTTLPGATVDQILMALMERRASTLRVRF